jgi:PsbP
METNRSSARACSTRFYLALVTSSVLWAAACSSAGNAASSETPSAETPTSPSSTGTASPSAEDNFVGLVYVNQEAGYTFHYPDDWVVVEGKGAGSVVVYAPPGDPRSSPANVSISLTPVAAGTSLKSYYRQTVGFLGVIPGFRLESTHRESFADLPAFSIAYSMSPKGTRFGALQITTLVGATAYSAIYSSTPKTYKRYLVDGGLIVRSFRLT